jgi:NitT/TauT family transport system ATP-binding protein
VSSLTWGSRSTTAETNVAEASGGPRGAVDLAAVHKEFPFKGQPLSVLEDVSLSVAEGEFVALVGPSGCGKSTLLRLMAGLIAPTSGGIRVFGGPPQEAVRQRQVGFVFQNPVLLPWRSVTHNVQLPLEVAGALDAQGRQRVTELIDLVGLQGFEDARPSQLSGGMRQRAALARALITRPRLLLLDEPFGALDEITRQRMNLELLRIWREVGVTSVLVTHSIPEAAFLANRVVVLSARPGRIMRVIDIDFDPSQRGTQLLRDRAFFATCAAISDALYGTMNA